MGAPALTEDEALAQLAAVGKVRMPRRRTPSPGAGLVGLPGVDLQAILDDVGRAVTALLIREWTGRVVRVEAFNDRRSCR